MYIEMNPTGLTLSNLICVAHRKRSEDTGFPYAVQSCRCSNCRYVSEGKSSLKECCCMAERVKAHLYLYRDSEHLFCQCKGQCVPLPTSPCCGTGNHDENLFP